MAITDFNKAKPLNVASVTGTPTISRTVPIKITSGDDTITGTGEIVLDWTNISTQADICVYDENDVLLDYYFESFDAIAETAVIWAYRAWVRDGSVQAKIAYGNGPSDQSVVASTVFSKEANIKIANLFNEDSGDLIDHSGNGNDATVSSSPYGATGQVGGAFDFDGIDDKTEAPDDASLDITSELTLEFWVRPDWGNAAWTPFIGKDDGTDVNYRFWIGDDKNLDIKGGASVSVDVSSYVSSGSWSHIFLSFDGTDIKTYVDGNLLDTSSYSLGNTNSAPFRIGMDTAGGSTYGDGRVDGLYLYNSGISGDIAQAKYAATKSSPDFFSQQAVELPSGEVTAYKIYGTVKIDSVAANRPVRIYKRDNGIFVAKSTPVSGEYTVANQEDGTQVSGTFISGEYLVSGEMYYATCIDNQGSYEAQTIDRIFPLKYTITP